MQRLEQLDLVGADLDAPGVGGHRRHLVLGQPRRRVQRQAGGGAAAVVAPLAPPLPEQARPHDDAVAGVDLDPFGGGGGVEVVGRDGVARFEGLDALVPGDVEEHAPHHHVLPAGGDAALLGAARRDEAGVEAVEHLPLEEDVAQAVPLGAGLVGHDDDVVGEAEGVGGAPVGR